MLFEFQTQVARLFGCDVANASMYDGSTACWEAIGMAGRDYQAQKGNTVAGSAPALCQRCQDHGQIYRRYARHSVARIVGRCRISQRLATAIDGETSCVVVQYPDILGRIADMAATG